MPAYERILIVDDDDAIRALLTTILRRRGLQVDAARNGLEALQLMGENRYALLLLDLMMPRLSGYGVLEKLKGIPAQERPTIVVITAGLEAPPLFDPRLVATTIHKPFDVDTLSEVVQSFLGKERPADPASAPDPIDPKPRARTTLPC